MREALDAALTIDANKTESKLKLRKDVCSILTMASRAMAGSQRRRALLYLRQEVCEDLGSLELSVSQSQ